MVATKIEHRSAVTTDVWLQTPGSSGAATVSAAAPKLVAGRTFESATTHRLLGAGSWQRWAGGGLAASGGEAQPLPWAAGLGKLGRESWLLVRRFPQCGNAHARAAAATAPAFSHTGAFWNNKGAYLPTLDNANNDSRLCRQVILRATFVTSGKLFLPLLF